MNRVDEGLRGLTEAPVAWSRHREARVLERIEAKTQARARGAFLVGAAFAVSAAMMLMVRVSSGVTSSGSASFDDPSHDTVMQAQAQAVLGDGGSMTD